ncbi:glutathione synthase [Oceanospirillum multiglobuliferum]|uniref:Glutathione synthetase n=1 Tax=Oceanospirillum multiglobuliferum TaxID=64969 RepID=A0A1T4RZN0_9GAMM|nr:glutathione synthase [Oceanospirillum multiglobuliferum]OPX54553.1 glutathione synthase [Oceanospirillum multiglobuliferum]SKA21443.1 glutathione synthase [Oceanospirillum multiglobuliferum]
MSIKLGVVMDPIQGINYKKDTTLAMLWAAQDQGWELFYMQQEDLFLRQGKAMAMVKPLKVFRDDQRWFELGDESAISMAELDVVLMRKDPPFDTEFLNATFLLEQAEREGVLVVNRPQSLRDCNEKLFAQQFPQCCPPTVVSRRADVLRAFHVEHQDVIFKPLDGMGGTGIFRVKEDGLNIGAILEDLTEMGQRQIMAQKYLPEIVKGDTRILMVDGVPIPYGLARIPAQGEVRGNLAAGGSGVGRPLTDRDYWICEQVAPVVKAKGLLFVGLDVIGDYLTELNVTSPTCVRELNDQFGLDIAGQLIDVIAKKLAER